MNNELLNDGGLVMSRRLTVFLGMVFTCLGLLAGFGSPAFASAPARVVPAVNQPLPVIFAPARAYTAPPGVGPNELAAGHKAGLAVVVLTCYVQVNYPHESGHNPGQVNVTATVTCDAPVSLIYMEVGLYRGAGLVSYKFFENTGKSYLSGQSNTSCVAGTYTGAADVTVDYPPGFYPPSLSGIFYSASIPITC